MDNRTLEGMRLDLRRVYTTWRPFRDDEFVDDVLRQIDGICVDITMTIEADQFLLPLEEV